MTHCGIFVLIYLTTYNRSFDSATENWWEGKILCWKFLSSIIAMHIMSLSLFWSNAVFLFIGPFLKAPLQRFNFPNIPCLKKSHVIFVIFSPQTKNVSSGFLQNIQNFSTKKKLCLWLKNIKYEQKMQQKRQRFIFQRIFSLITMKAKCTGDCESNIYPQNVETVVQHCIDWYNYSV